MLRTFLKYLSWTLVPSVILAWCGLLTGGVSGAIAGALLGAAAPVLFLFFVEKFWIRELGSASRRPSPGMAVSMYRAVGMPNRGPRVFILQTPHPMVLCARSLGGSGTIWVSDGALGSGSERDLQAALRRAFVRLRNYDEPIRGIAAWMSYRYLERPVAPRDFFAQVRWIFLRWIADAMNRLADTTPSQEGAEQSPTWSVIYGRLSV